MKFDAPRTLAMWVALLAANLVLLSLGRHRLLVNAVGHPSILCDVGNLLLGVVILPAIAVFVSLVPFRGRPLSHWNSGTLLLFSLGMVFTSLHLFVATLWMVHRTDFMPDPMSRMVHTVLSYAYVFLAPVVVTIAAVMWIRRHRI
jgi:hypothetical protein